MATTMGTSDNFYVTKTAFYWAIGVLVLLFAAVSISMSRNISRLNMRSDIARPAATSLEMRGTDTTTTPTTVPPGTAQPGYDPGMNNNPGQR